ncbi:hypothetical protein OIU77_002549 [Salix suchowensis]|uniref:Uncharacterized protein n=1 Tax=Salix suchowensis TaxID=1278906 RepID=A0ABQ9AWW9_9ROSI|nr:hypothetical protein OIU77_002549 [Salix suchowensis]
MEHRGVIWVDLNDIYFDTDTDHIDNCYIQRKKGYIEPDRQAVKKVVTEVELRALEDILAHVASQTTKEEQEYIAEENIQNQVQKDHIDLQRKFSLMEAIVKETKALQDLTKIARKCFGRLLMSSFSKMLCNVFEVPNSLMLNVAKEVYVPFVMQIMLRSWVVFFSQMRNYFRWSCHVTLFNLKRTCLYNCYNGCRSKVMEIVSPKFTVPNQSCCTKMATAIYDWIPKLSNDQSQTEIHGEGNGLDWCFCDPAWNSEDCDPSTVDSSGSLWDMN